MASDINGNQIVNLVNSLIGQRINAQVSWGTNAYPENSIPGWFKGPTSEIGAFSGGDAVSGDTGAVKLREAIMLYSVLFNHISRKRIIIYYNRNNVLEVMTDNTAIGNFADPVNQAKPLASAPQPLTDISLAAIQNHINDTYNEWWNLAGAPVTGTLTNTVCHYSCHSNCHENRGRR